MASNKNSKARVIIELLCTILEDNDIFLIRAETFRQAKFDKESRAKEMGQLLFCVVSFCDGPRNCHPRMMDSNEQKMVYIKTKLQTWGYLNQSFSSLPNDFSFGSREMLLALGWVIYEQSFIDKLIQNRSSPLHKGLVNFGMKANVEPGEVYAANAMKGLPAQDRIQYHLMLTGKLRMSLRRLHSTCMHLASLTRTIHQSTKEISLQQSHNHLTPLEVHILRYPQSLKQMVQEFEKDNEELTHLLEWKQKEDLFWDWMGSVLATHNEDLKSSSAGDQSVYLPVPANMGQQIEAGRALLRDTILRNEPHMTRLEHLLSTKKVSDVELEVYKMHLDKEMLQKALELRSCAFGQYKYSDSLTGHHHSKDSVSSEALTRRKPFTDSLRERQGNEILSPYEEKVAKQTALMQAVNTEISSLEDKVRQLQLELQQKQVQYMQRLQNVINKEENFICIQPRPLKQHLDS